MNTTDSLLIPITWARMIEPDMARRGVETLIQALLELPDAFDLTFHIAAGGGEPPSAGFVIDAADTTTRFRMVERIRLIAQVTTGHLGLGDPVLYEPVDACAASYVLNRAAGPGRHVLHFNATPWAAARRLPTRTTMDVKLNRLIFDDGDTTMRVRCSATIRGDAGDSSLVATLVAADTPGTVRLGACPGSTAEITLPLDMAAHLVASPCRLYDAWPSHPVPLPSSIVDAFEDAVPPHGVVFGGSGQGKTTFLEHRLAAAVERGRTAMVLCPTGDLAARATSILCDLHAPFDAIDFGSDRPAPRFNLCEPPPGIDPRDHIADIISSIEQAWDGRLSTEMFGPVGRRALRAGLSLLVLDPHGPWPITRLTEVLGAGRLPSCWAEALERIDDPAITSLVLETRRAIENDKEGNYAPWILSKLEPFLSAARMRRIIDESASTVSVDGLSDRRHLVVSAPGATLGEEGTTVMLGLLMARLWHLAQQRPVGDRLAVDVIVDEAHRAPGALLRTMLAESRKFGVRLLLATQSTSSVPAPTLNSILANCGAIGTFRVGPADAALLDQKYPTVAAGALQRLARHWMAVTTGDRDIVGPTPPNFDPRHVSALDHLPTNSPT